MCTNSQTFCHESLQRLPASRRTPFIRAAISGILSLSLWFCSCVVQPSLCGATGADTEAEAVYTLTEAELSQLQNNLNRLAEINRNLQTESTGQVGTISTLQAKLEKAESLSRDLQNQLAELKAKSSAQEALLTKANASLNEFAQEEKRTRLRIKAQRNTWEGIAAGLLIFCAAK